MNTLVVGATGATGRLLVEELLNRGQNVRVIVRSPHKLPAEIKDDNRLSMIRATLLDLSDPKMAEYVEGCDAIASCLGHPMSLKGIFGPPRRLVTDATRRLCEAVKANEPGARTKFVLMNTAGNRNPDRDEPVSFAQKCVVGLLRLLIPPHADNEEAADYLQTEIGHNDGLIEWSVVRPDDLIDEEDVTEYEVHPSPTRSAIFDAGVTSRINVAHLMADLISDDTMWDRWKGEMPVIYNEI